MNDYAGFAAALLTNCGEGNLPPVCAPELVRDGQLVEVMPAWRFPARGLRVMHLGARRVARAIRMLVNFAAERASSLFLDLLE